MKKPPAKKRIHRIDANIPTFRENWISEQLAQYPAGARGISYFRGDVNQECWVDCLLYRDAGGAVVGVFNYFSVDIPPYEQKGNFNILVASDWRRNGIATALLNEAVKRWNISFVQQRCTPDGAAFLTARTH